MPHLVATALAGAALALLPAVPATAGGPPVPATELRLTLTYPDTTTSGTRTVILLCDPAGGGHPQAARACAELARSGGKFESTPRNVACTLEYAPVIAEARGQWRGRPTRFRAEYSNDCALHAHTGSIFAF